METNPHPNHPHKHFSPVSFLAGLLIALGVFFIIYKLVPHNGPPEKKSAVNDSIKVDAPVFAPQKDSLDFTEEHFYKEHHHRHIDRDAEAIVVSPNEAEMLEKGNLSGQQKKLLELLPNAPVIYIFDLKITDYQTFYFDMGVPRMLNDKQLAGQVLHDALKEFTEKKFGDCFTKMMLLSLANSKDVNALFYGGMAAYYKKDFKEAELRFQKTVACKNNTFHQEANWFMAMTLFENNKREEAKKLLQEIADTKGFYAERAAKLLKSLTW
jgi:hypothetical protein